MRDTRRIHRMCLQLEEIWQRNQDLRMGQLLSVVIFRGVNDNQTGNNLWNQEDDVNEKKMLEWIRKYREM